MAVGVGGNAHAAGMTDTSAPQEYIVVKDDNLSQIADTYQTTWKRLYDKNTNINNPHLIHVGQAVVIPASDEQVPSRELPTPTTPVAPPVVTPVAPVVTPQPEKVESDSPSSPPAPAPVDTTASAYGVGSNVSGEKHTLMAAAGIAASDYEYVDYIISHESSWVMQWNKGGSGAYGLCQSLPASKMASAGEDYMTNPVTQLKWCHTYAVSRYESWAGAYNHWCANKWW